MTARLDVSGAFPAARRFISERTRQNEKTSQVTTNAPTTTLNTMSAILEADTVFDLSRLSTPGRPGAGNNSLKNEFPSAPGASASRR